MIDLSDLDSWQPAKAGGLDLSDLDSFKPKSATLRANASGSAGVEAPKSAWIDETMGQYTRDRAGIDRLHEEAKAAGVPLGRAVKWKRSQLERQDREGVLQPPTTAPLSLGDVDERNVSERAAAIRAAEMIQSSPLATWPNTGANTAIPGEADNNELTSALDVLENYRKKVAPEVPGPQFMRQMLPRATPQKVAPDPNGSWTAAGESMLQGIRQSVAGRAQALGEKSRYSGNYVPAIRGLLDAPANLLRTEGYEQGAEALGRMGELGAQMAPEPTGSVYDDPAGWLRYYGQQGVASSGQTLTGVAAGLVNPALGAAEFLSGAAGSEYGRARIEDNATPSEAGVRGLIAAGTEGIPEMVGGAAMLGRLPLMKLAQSTARGRAAISLPVEAGTELATEKANIEIERARGKYISPEEESKRLRDAGVIGSLMGGTIGAGSAVVENGVGGIGNIRETIRQANSAADISSPMAAAFTRAAQETTARILTPNASPDAVQGAQIADDAFRAAGVGTVAASDMAEQDALARDLDAAQRDQLSSEAEIDRLLTGGINAQAQARSPRTVLDGQDAGRASAAIPGFSGSLPAGVRTSYPGDQAESGAAVGFVGDGSLGSSGAPAPQQFTELANGTIFVPGDPVQLRQRAADAGFDVRGLAETRNGVPGVRFGTGARDQVISLFGGADPAISAEQSQPSAPPEAAASMAPPALDAKRTYGDTVFDERAHDLLDFIALNGGLDRTALESEGIDPANWNSRAAKGKNDRFFGKPLFRKSGGMSLETLREKARDAGFRTDKDVLDLIGDSLGGRKTFTPAGSEYQTALADVARQEADAQARQQRVNALPPSVPETDADAYIASRETEFDAPADRDGTDIADIESTLASVADTSPQQRASTQSLGGDYTAKLLQYKKDRRAWGLNPQQEQEYQDLLELDRETGKVGGRPMVGVRNKTAYVDALDAGELLPVQGFTDADDFKTLNDKLGHAAGDDAIREIGDALVAEFGEGNVFHRSGDEFLFQGTDQADVDAKMQRVRDRLSQITLRATDASGNVQEQRGIGLSYGTGTDEASADAALVADKQRRKESGQRVGQRRTSDRRGVGSESAGERVRAGEGRGDSAAEGLGDARQVGNADSLAAGEDGGSDGRVAGRVPAGPVQPLVQAGRGTVQSIRAAISQALGPKFLARLDNQRWFQIVDSVADLPPDVRKSITGEGVAGFVLPDGRVFIVAEGAAANPVGVTLHELGVHYGMTGILGEDFAPTLAKFKRLRAKDDRVGRAYERATEAADKDKNGELTEAAKATLDEEALAYFVEENWDSPDTRGIVYKVIDAIKRLLNRWGIRMSWLNASPELLREVAIGAARMAADGRITVGKDGKIVYARDLLGEAPSETAQLVAQWKARVDAKLRGDGRAYVKPSEGPGDLFGGPAEETADLFAKPQQRAQGTLFSRKRDNSTAAEDRALDRGDLEEAMRIGKRRIAEQREALGDISNGVILKMEGRDSWAIVMPDVEGGGKWRMQMFDRRGFVGHRTRNSRDAALDEALQDKYTTRDDGALDEIQDSPEFVRGNFIAGEMMQLNAGKITSAEFDRRIADYDSSVKVVAKYSRTTQTGRIRKTVAELTNAADSMGSWRDWYDRHDQTLRDVFGDDAELFQKLLSASSQAASVPANIGLALKAYRQMFSGEPFVGYLPAVIKNLERVAENVALRGQKISEYGSANEGNADAIAVDRHIAMLFFGTKSPNRKQVAAAKNRIRAIAERLGWQPREVQAALWAYNQTLLGTAPENVKSYDKLIEASRARIDALRASIGRGEDRGAREVGGTDGRVGAPERDTETGRGEAGEVAVKYSRKADGGSVSRVIYRGTNDSGERIRGGIAEGSLFAAADEKTARAYAGSGGKVERIGVTAAANILVEGTAEFARVTGRRRGKLLDTMRSGENLKTASDDAAGKARAAGYDALEFTSFKDLGIVIFDESKFIRDLPDEPTKYSRRTITISGTERPTTDSTGKSIHPTEEGVRKFWEWFGSSKITDESAVVKSRDDVRAARSKLDFDDSRLASLADTHPLYPIITRSRAKHAAELDDAKSYLAVVQASAPPVQVFHGGGGHIDAFRRKSRAIWMAEAVAANTYGDGVGGAVYPLYARIENPMTFDADGATWQQLEFEGERVSTDDLADIAESRGHDGLIINNLRDEDTDDGGDTSATHYAVFAPEQVKSATGNTGTFSPTDPRIAYSRKIPRTSEQAAALAKAGMPEDNRTLIQRGKDYLGAQWANVKELASSNITQSVFDRFHRMSAIEQDLGIPAERSAYLSARLAAGLPSIMEGLMMYAAPKWEGGVLTVDDTTVGLLDALKPVKDDINGWLGWMVGRRAKALKAQGRENLMTDTDIDALLSLSAGKEAAFKDAALKYLRIKKAVLDVAEQAGLIDPVGRASWDSVEYIPFYRQDETEGDTIGPGTRQGLSKQSSGIQKLKGGQQNLADPLGNIVRNFTRLIDASLKNNAMLEAVKEYGPTFFEKVPMSGSFERIAMSQVKKVLLERGVPQSLIDAMPQDTLVGLTKLWAVKPPTDDDVVRVMRDGKPEYYRVPDKDLLASLTAFKVPSMHWALSPFKFFKKLLTVGVTSSPEFMARNFVRDSLSSWVISDDKFRVGWDSVKGIISPLLDKTTQKEMMFAGGSFIGGQFYSVGSEEATADALRRALRDKGLKSKDVEQFVGTIARTPLELWDKWQKVGSYFENANRNAIYENAIKAGRSKKEAAYLARDLMDFSMHGNSQFIQFLSDVLPFFNARLQGLYKLYRQGGKKALRKALLMRAGTVVAGTLALMAWNMMFFADGYDELEEWDKDTYWHIMPGTPWHIRVPKPFELGVLFATVPERLARAVTYQVPGGDSGDRPRQTLDSFLTQVGGTLAMNPIPQGVMPIVEQWANKTFFTGRPIENMGDEKLLPEARAEWYTSDTARVVSDVIGNKTGLSPKRIEHLWNGYTGTVGAYALDTVDWLVRSIEQKPERPELAWAEMPLLKAFYRGDMVPKSTRYSTEFYEIALKTEQISNTIKDYEVAGQKDKARALEEKHADLLGSRKSSKQAKAGFMHTNVQMLNKAKDELAEIRKQIEGIVGMPGFSAEQKREKIDALAQKRNKIARDITVALRRTSTSSR